MKIIRSDRVKIQTSPDSHQALTDTLGIYRSLVRDLMVLINAQWKRLGHCDGNAIVQAVEQLIHPTSQRPEVKTRYFANRYYKFPSYLRRVAIMDAAGQVRSFRTRFDQWLDGQRRHKQAKPPKLTCATGTCPSLYQGQCIKLSERGDTAAIKVYWQKDWIWMTFPLTGRYRYRGQGKQKSPLLTYNSRKGWALSVPSKLIIPDRQPTACTGRVLAVDVGINTTATCAVIDQHGTVLHREFIRRGDKDREYRMMQRIREAAKKATRHGNKLPPGFKRQDHRRLRQLADNEAQQISRYLANLAQRFDCDAVVLENLKGWRPKGGRKRMPMKVRFHRWYHRMLSTRIEAKACEFGIKTVWVYARGTSSWAFDGSGKVRRDRDNYAMCTFPNGKRYNADLNAAYQIAVRGILKLYYPALREQLRGDRPLKSDGSLGNPITLSWLWANKARHEATEVVAG